MNSVKNYTRLIVAGNYSRLILVVKLDRCVGSCNTLNDLSNNVCAPNKPEDLNIHVFNMIKEKNE